MTRTTGQLGDSYGLLLVVAAASEARAILGRDAAAWTLTQVSPRVDLVVAGVGKANAAGAAARFWDARRHGAILSLGIGGALPGAGVAIGQIVVATSSVFADEGVEAPGGFEDLASRGFPPWMGPGNAVPVDERVRAWLFETARPIGAVCAGPVATVSVCSGTDTLAGAIAARTGAIAEAMEGAAVGASAARLGAAFGEVRVISNTTGDRVKQQWDLRGSLEMLGCVGRALIGAAPSRGA